MAYYELNGKKVYIADKQTKGNVARPTQQYQPIVRYQTSYQPAIQPQLYSDAYIQPQHILLPAQSSVYLEAISDKEKEIPYYMYEDHELAQAPDCNCEFCHTLKCDCHSCNPRRYCKCFYCEKLQDNKKKMIIKKDFLPSEQIQKVNSY